MVWNTIEHSMLQDQPYSRWLYEVYLTMEKGVQMEVDRFEFKPEGLVPVLEFLLEYGL